MPALFPQICVCGHIGKQLTPRGRRPRLQKRCSCRQTTVRGDVSGNRRCCEADCLSQKNTTSGNHPRSPRTSPCHSWVRRRFAKCGGKGCVLSVRRLHGGRGGKDPEGLH